MSNKDSPKFIDNLNEIYGIQEHNKLSEAKGENSYKWISALDTRSINSKTDDKIQKFMNEIYLGMRTHEMTRRDLIRLRYSFFMMWELL